MSEQHTNGTCPEVVGVVPWESGREEDCLSAQTELPRLCRMQRRADTKLIIDDRQETDDATTLRG